MNNIPYETLILAGNFWQLLPVTEEGYLWLADRLLSFNNIKYTTMIYNVETHSVDWK